MRMIPRRQSEKANPLHWMASYSLIKNHGSLNNWRWTLTKEVKLQMGVKGRTEMRCHLLKKAVAHAADILRFQLIICWIWMSFKG